MTDTQKLEAIITHFRQMLADEQFKAAQLTVLLEEKNKRIQELEKELQSSVQEKTDNADTPNNYA